VRRVIADQRGQPLGRDKLVAATDEFRNFVPIDFTDVQAECGPSFRCEIGGQKKSAGLSGGERFVVSGENFAGDSDDAVSVMVVEEIGKRLFSNQEAGVLAVVPARGLGKRKADFGKPDQATVFGLLHTAPIGSLNRRRGRRIAPLRGESEEAGLYNSC
jgi:hypothetical protein